jgi:hypothetical protein
MLFSDVSISFISLKEAEPVDDSSLKSNCSLAKIWLSLGLCVSLGNIIFSKILGMDVNKEMGL